MLIKIINKALIALLAVMLAIAGYIGFQKIVIKNDMPPLFGFRNAVIASGSMEPALAVGDLIVVREQEEYHVGDVVMFRSDDSYIVHRIVGTVASGFITQGDANNISDKNVLPADNILGKQVLAVPRFGSVADFVRSPAGLLLIVAGAALIIGVPQIKKILMKRQGTKTEIEKVQNKEK